jgi:hypothetical protein
MVDHGTETHRISIPVKAVFEQRNKMCFRFDKKHANKLKNGVFWDVTPCGSHKSHTA